MWQNRKFAIPLIKKEYVQELKTVIDNKGGIWNKHSLTPRGGVRKTKVQQS